MTNKWFARTQNTIRSQDIDVSEVMRVVRGTRVVKSNGLPGGFQNQGKEEALVDRNIKLEVIIGKFMNAFNISISKLESC